MSVANAGKDGFLPPPSLVDLKSLTWFYQLEYISTNQIDQIGGHMSLSLEPPEIYEFGRQDHCSFCSLIEKLHLDVKISYETGNVLL